MKNYMRFSAWAFLASFACIFGGGFLGGFMPPLPATISAGELAAHYTHHHTGILWFSVVQSVGSILWMPFVTAISVAMMRMEPRSLFLPLLHFMAGFMAVLTPFLGCVFFAAAALNPGISPDVVQAFHNTGMMLFQSSLATLVEGLVLGFAILSDRSTDPIFPKWLAWVNIVYAILGQFTLVSIFFRTGPLAGDGLLGMQLPDTAVLIYIVSMAVAMFRIKPAHWVQADQLLRQVART